MAFDAELFDEWLRRLRSGDYAQTQQTLRDEKGYCCLGVLCDIVKPDGWTIRTPESMNELEQEKEAGVVKYEFTLGAESSVGELVDSVGHRIGAFPNGSPLFVYANDVVSTDEHGELDAPESLRGHLPPRYDGSPSETVGTLVDANDSFEMTFAEIADLIEFNRGKYERAVALLDEDRREDYGHDGV